MSKRFKYIHQLTIKEKEELYKLLQSEDMGLLGNGQKWSKSKLDDRINYSKKDYKNKFKNTNYIFLVFFVNNKLIGLCYLHPGINKYYENYIQPAIIIKKNERNKGYSRIILNKLIKLNKKYFKKTMIGVVKYSNMISQSICKNYKKIDEIKINNILYYVYEIKE